MMKNKNPKTFLLTFLVTFAVIAAQLPARAETQNPGACAAKLAELNKRNGYNVNQGMLGVSFIIAGFAATGIGVPVILVVVGSGIVASSGLFKSRLQNQYREIQENCPGAIIRQQQ